MPERSRDSSERLSLIVETQRDIAEAGHDLEAVMQLVAERSQALTGADGAMVNLIEGDMLRTRAVTGIAVSAARALRPLSSSVAKYAIETGRPLLIEDAPSDPRINQDLRGRVGDQSLICVPLFGGGKVIGTINVMSRSERNVLREEHRQTMEMISVVLSAAVSQAAEFEARRGQAEALARLRTLFEGVSIGILRLGRDGRAVEVNPALEQMLGYTAAEFGALSLFDYVHPAQAQRAEVLFDELMGGRREPFQTEAQLVRKDGELVWGQVSAALECDRNGAPAFVVAMIENITNRKSAEAELIRQARLSERQALHDPLTDLPNRLLFGDRIERAIIQAERGETRLGVVMMDLDRFKEVNDSLGHTAGDELLTEVGQRLRGALRASDTAAQCHALALGQVREQQAELVAPQLRRAMEERELVLYYQPKAVLADGEVRSVEALLRWRHPTRGLIFPDSFIPLAQETGLIRPLTLYVVDEALRQCRLWRDEGLGLSVSVNLSMRNLLYLEFPSQVAALLARREVEPELLELEMTESAMLANPTRTTGVLCELSALGIKLSVDDFGTGYSSLAYLHQLPIDEIKIDRSFVTDMGNDHDNLAIVQCTIDLGRNLGLDVVAEGVETREVWEMLCQMGCKSAQGYFLSRPVPPEQLSEWLRTHRAGVAPGRALTRAG
jgi:diguanylate cyclase (GGDEF)-like protein/PAS domain S-box-containing protein